MTKVISASFRHGRKYRTANPFLLVGVFNVDISHFVRNQTTVDIGFTPVLSIYATANYVESQLLPGHVESLLWTHDLNDPALPDPVFDLTWDDEAKDHVLKQTN